MWKEEKMGASDVTAPPWLAQRCRLDETGISLNWSLIRVRSQGQPHRKQSVLIPCMTVAVTAKLIFKPKSVLILTSLVRAIISIIHSYWQEVALHKDKVRQTQTQLFAVLWKCCWRLSGRTQWPSCSKRRKGPSFMKKINFTWEKPPWKRGEDTNNQFSAHLKK